MLVPESTTSATNETPNVTNTSTLGEDSSNVVEETPIDFSDDIQMFDEPVRSPAQGLQELEMAARPFKKKSAQEEQAVQVKTQEDYENSYSLFRDAIAGATGPVRTYTGFTIDVMAEGVEDVANAGIDAAEFILQQFNNDVSFENIDYISKTLPESEFQDAARTMIQLMAGYGGVLKAAKASRIINPNTGRVKDAAVKFASYLSSESTFNNVTDRMFSEDMMRKLPFYNDMAEYVDEEIIGESKAAQRLKNGLYASFEAMTADKIMDMFSLIRKANQARKIKKQIEPSLSGEAMEMFPAVPEEGKQALAAVENMKRQYPKNSSLRYDVDGGVQRLNINADTPPEIPDYILAEEALKLGNNPNFLKLTNDQGQRVFRNLTTIDSNDDFRALVAEFYTKNQDFLGKIKYTDDMVRAAAKSWNMTPEKLIQWTESKGLKLGQILAAKSIQSDAFYQIRAFSDGLIAGRVSYEDYAVMYENTQFISRTVSNMEALASALLRENRVPTTPGAGTAEASARAFEIIARGEKLVEQYGPKMYKYIARDLSKLTDEAIERMASKSPSRVFDNLTQLRMSGMLSSPTLIVRNTLSSMSLLGTELLEAPISSLVGAARIGTHSIYSALMKSPGPSPARVHFAETAVMAQGLVQGVVEATAITGSQMLAKTKGLPGLRKLFPDMKKPQEFLGVRAGKTKISDDFLMSAERAHDFWSGLRAAISIPGYTIRWQDDFTKHVAMRMKLNQEAYRVAAGEVRTGNSVSNAVRRAEIMEKALLDSKTMDRLAQFGEEMTFTNKPKTSVGQYLTQLTNPDSGVAGKIMFTLAPFMRANVNAITYTMDRVPLVNMLMKHNQEAFRTLGTADPRSFDTLVAQSLTLPTVMGAIAYTLNANDMLVGARPKQDGRLFDSSGVQEFSIRTSDGKTVSYPVETPMGALLAGIHTISQINDVVQGENDEFVADAGSIILMGMLHTFNPEFLASGTSALLKALNDNDSTSLEALTNLGLDVTGQFLPYSSFARRWNRSAGQGEGEFQRDANPGKLLPNLMDALFNEALAVYAPEKLPAKRDFFGQKMDYKQGYGGILSPFNFTTINSDPVMRKMVELVDGIDQPLSKKRTIKVNNISFTDTEIELFPAPNRMVTISGLDKSIRLNNNEYERLSLLTAGLHPETEKPLAKGSTYRDIMQNLFDGQAFKKSSLADQQRMASQMHRAMLQVGAQMYVSKTYSAEDIMAAAQQLFQKFEE